MSSADERSELSPLTLAFRSAALLVFEGMSVGLLGWTLRASARLPAYITSNTLTPVGRKFVVVNMAAGALVFLLAGVALLVWRRRPLDRGIDLVHRVSHRLAPLILSAFLPLLFNWRLWTGGRELTFVFLVAVFGLSLQGLMRLALETPPILEGRAASFIERKRAELRELFGRLPALPLALVVLGALAYSVYFSKITIDCHYRLGTAGYDLGIEANLVWNAIHFTGPLFKTSVLGGPDSTHLGWHQTYIAYLFGLFYLAAPKPQTLLIIQASLVGGAALPLFLFARRHIGAWPACLVAFLCLLYPPLHGSNLYDFHYLPLAPFFLFLSLWLLEARRDRWAVVAVILTLAAREDFSALLAVVGVYLIVTGERPRAGLLVTAVAGAYFVVVKLILMPRFLGGWNAYINQYKDLIPEGDSGFMGILKTVFGNPGYTMTTLLEREKLLYILQIMTPLVFFCWRRPIGLLCTVPGFLFTFLATKYPPLLQISFQYTAYWTSFLFIAVVANLAWLRRRQAVEPAPVAPAAAPPEDPFPPAYAAAAPVDMDVAAEPPPPPPVVHRPRQRSVAAWLVAMTVATLMTSHQFGAVLQRNTVLGGFGPFRFGVTDEDRKRHDDLYKLMAQIPGRAKVAASEMVVAHVSSRPDAYSLKIGVFDAQYLLVWMPPRGDEHPHVLAAIQSGAFGVVDEKGEFVLAKRGHPTTKNAPILARIPH
jgi:uncharacterized membrane protein